MTGQRNDDPTGRSRSPFNAPSSIAQLGPPQLADWNRRLNVVTGYVGRLCHHRTVWRTTWDIVEANPDFPSQPYLFAVYTEHYLTAQAIAIRRQVESSERHHQTVGRLLRLLENGASDITRHWYCSLYPDDSGMQAMANSSFDDFAMGTGVLTASPQWFERRRTDLEEIALPVRQFVNRRVAHLDHRPVATAGVSDLDAAIDVLRQVVVELHLLLRAKGLVDPEPVTQWDWTAELAIPWLTTGDIGTSEGGKTVTTERPYEDGETLTMVDGDYVVVGNSRPLTNNPNQFATTIRRR